MTLNETPESKSEGGSTQVNIFQSRIKDVTRKMMATVSELSMHQATAHKLQAATSFPKALF